MVRTPGGAPATGSPPAGPAWGSFGTGESTAVLRFYEELNDFLPKGLRKRAFPYAFRGSPTVKEAIEANRVPPTEVDLIVVDGEPVGFDYRLRHGDRVAVYPMFESLDISPVARLRPAPLRRTAFLLDAHLEELARMLRMLGLDAAQDRRPDPAGIAGRAAAERRILLTRDPLLPLAPGVTRAYWVRRDRPEDQVGEVLERFDLRASLRPFTRCLSCNGTLRERDEGGIAAPLGGEAARHGRALRRCAACGKVFEASPFLQLASRVAGAAGR